MVKRNDWIGTELQYPTKYYIEHIPINCQRKKIALESVQASQNCVKLDALIQYTTRGVRNPFITYDVGWRRKIALVEQESGIIRYNQWQTWNHQFAYPCVTKVQSYVTLQWRHPDFRFIANSIMKLHHVSLWRFIDLFLDIVHIHYQYLAYIVNQFCP